MPEPARVESPYVLGVDIGTTSTKVGVFDRHGTPLASAHAGYPITRPAPDRAEQDADAWWASVNEAVAAIAADTDLSAVRAIGLTGQVDTHVLVDDDLDPVRPALVWQDVRTADRAAELSEWLGAEGLRAGWGEPSPLDSSNPVVRALWLAEDDPQAWETGRWLLLPKDHVNARLTGMVAADPLGSFKVADAHGSYVAGIRYAPGLAERLPPLQAPESVLGEVPRRWHGIPAGVVAATGTMDAFGNVLGSGLSAPGEAMLVIGTSVIIAAIGTDGVGGNGVVTFAPYRGRQVYAGPTQAGGDALRWWSAASGHSIPEVLAAAGATSPGSGGVVFAPHLLGERAPLWDGEVRGWFTGIHAGTGFAELSRAVLEGVAYSARELLEAVEVASGESISALTLSGGGSRSLLWAQIMADVTGRALHRSRTTDTSVVGAAVLGSAALTGGDPWTASAQLAQLDVVLEPEERVAAVHDHHYSIYRRTYRELRDVHSMIRDAPEVQDIP